MRIAIAALLLVGPVGPLGCDSGTTMMMTGGLTVTSTAFTEGGTIPTKYGDDQTGCGGGSNTSPPLAWSGASASTMGFAVIMEDLDFPLIHWLVWDIPATTSLLLEGTPSYKQGGDYHPGTYGGPCPPTGETHSYRFTVYALDSAALGPSTGAGSAEVQPAVTQKMLAKGSLTGRFTP